MLLSRLLNRWIRVGRLTVVDAHGRTHVFQGDGGPSVGVRLHDPSLHWRLLLRPEFHTAEAYVDGALTLEEGTLYDFLQLAALNMRAQSVYPPTLQRLGEGISAALSVLDRYNPVGVARRKVSHHYDLTGELFDLFLDRDRQYSCAYFARPDDDLDRAQEQKKRHIAAKLLLRPGQRVLDIGSGWGGLALYLANRFDVEVTGVTLSHEQHRVSSERARQSGLADRVCFKLQDYREENGIYDRIVSIGMFEHVGKPHYREFFDKVGALLSDDGVALLHSIGKYTDPGPVNAWVRKHIFPGTYVPTLSEVLPWVERARLWVTDLEVLRLHYADTLRAWNRRFQHNRDKARALYDERFCRMWEFYLQACEVGFRHMSQMVFQMQLAKRRDAVPLIRDYMFETERALAEDALSASERAA